MIELRLLSRVKSLNLWIQICYFVLKYIPLYRETLPELFRFGSVPYLLTVFIKNEQTNARRAEINF